MRFVWTEEMDYQLSQWLQDKYDTRTPNPDLVSWREGEGIFVGAKASYIRKRYLGVVSAEKRSPLSEEEAQLLIDSVESMGFSWEEMAKKFEGRTGLQLKNYYYTAMRRHIRRRGGLKYSSRRAYPTIDAYFSRMESERPWIFERPGRIKRARSDETVSEDAFKRACGEPRSVKMDIVRDVSAVDDSRGDGSTSDDSTSDDLTSHYSGFEMLANVVKCQ